MTRIYTDGFEGGDLTGVTELTYSVCSLQAVAANNYGSGAYAILLGTAGYFNILKPAVSESYFRFRMTTTTWATGTWFSVLSGATVLVALNFDTTYGYITSLGVSSVHPIVRNTNYLIEVYIKIGDAPDGRLIIKVDGVTEIDFTGDTKPDANTTFTNIKFSTTTASVYLDDIAINNTSGAVDNSWCGDGRIIMLKPNANGNTSQLTGSDSNQTDNYLLVDEVPFNSDTDYVQSATAGEYDLYNIENFSIANQNINRIWIEGRAKNATPSGRSAYLKLLVSGYSSRNSTIKQLFVNYTLRLIDSEYLLNPENSSAWSIADIDALQIGFEVGP